MFFLKHMSSRRISLSDPCSHWDSLIIIFLPLLLRKGETFKCSKGNTEMRRDVEHVVQMSALNLMTPAFQVQKITNNHTGFLLSSHSLSSTGCSYVSLIKLLSYDWHFYFISYFWHSYFYFNLWSHCSAGCGLPPEHETSQAGISQEERSESEKHIPWAHAVEGLMHCLLQKPPHSRHSHMFAVSCLF